MKKYQPGDDVGKLELWPFGNPASNYRIREGTPQASGRIDAGGPGHRTRYGIWHCTTGVFDCTEQGDELMVVLSGKCRITMRSTGAEHELGPGDTLMINDQSEVTWHILEDVTKVFFAHKSDGYT